jgi:hypothetical protein
MGRMRPQLLALALATLLAPLLCSCATVETKPHVDTAEEEREHLLFALPHWCSWGGRRETWHSWEAAQGRSPTGNGVCGVQLPLGEDEEELRAKKPEDGICIEYQGGVVSRTEVRTAGRPHPLQIDAPTVTNGGWTRAKEAYQGPLPEVAYRVRGDAIEARVEGADEIARGPCFWR